MIRSIVFRKASLVGVLCAAMFSASCTRSTKLDLGRKVPTFEKGFQLFPSPRMFDGPGTVFRIDGDGVRRAVADLSTVLSVRRESEVVPHVVSARRTEVSGWLSLGSLSRGEIQAEVVDSAFLSVFGAVREFAYEATIEAAVDSVAKLLDWSRSGRVYIITETISADSVELGFVRRNAVSLADTASAVRAAGGAIRWHPVSSSRLAVAFGRPHRVLYKAEELVRRRPLEPGGRPALARVPVDSALIWRP